MNLTYEPPLRTAYLDGIHRYSLGRTWDPSIPGVVWIMLNPSTADASVDDPTIRRCIGFTRSWGYGWLTVVNLFALRATQPETLLEFRLDEVIGPKNDETIRGVLSPSVARVVCAWGANPIASLRAPQVRKLVAEAGHEAWALRWTKSGAPQHPLYVPGDTTLWPYDAGAK